MVSRRDYAAVCIFVRFQERDRQNSPETKNDTFYKPPVSSAQCIFGTEKYADSGIKINYADGNYSQGYGQIKEAFECVTKYDIFQHCPYDQGFRSSNREDGVLSLVLFRIFPIYDNKKDITAAQTKKLEFIFCAVAPAGVNGFALVLTNNA